MIFSNPIFHIELKDIGHLYEAIKTGYQYLSNEHCEYVAKCYFLELDGFSNSDSEYSNSVTCNDLIELIVDTVSLRFHTGFSEDRKNNCALKLFQLYNNTVWKTIFPESFFISITEQQVKNYIWQSFLNKIKKDTNLRMFDFVGGKLVLRKLIFQEFMRSQMIVYSLKTINREESPVKFAEYHAYFASLLEEVLSWNTDHGISKDEFKELVSSRVLDFMIRINKPDFKLSSSLDTYFFGFIKNGLKNYYSKKNKLLALESIENVNVERENFQYIEEQMILREERDRDDFYKQVALEHCKKEEKRTQDILIMSHAGVSHAVIGRVVKESVSNVGTIIYRFNKKVRKILNK